MQKYKKLLVVLLCIAVLVNVVPKMAYADALTAAMVGQIAYGIASASGISFTAGNATGSGMTSFMTSQVEDYVNSHGGSLSNLFGTEVARIAAAKMAVGYQLYNGVVDFIGWMADKFNLSDTDTEISPGTVDGQQLALQNQGVHTLTGVGVEGLFTGETSVPEIGTGYRSFGLYFNGTYMAGYTNNSLMYRFGNSYSLSAAGGQLTVKAPLYYVNSGAFSQYWSAELGRIGVQNTLQWDGSDYVQPQPLPQGKEWEGDFSGTPGFAEPPTDLPDFLSRIPAAVADNQLVVYEEITDAGNGDNPPPTPSPSPSPRPEPDPVPQITIAQKIAAILGEIMGLIGLTGDTPLTEEQQQQIADTAQNIEDSVKDVTQNITDTITQQRTETSYNIQDQTQTITQGQQQIKDAIQDQTQTLTDTLPDIKDAIQDQTQTLTDTLPDIKDAIQDQTQTLTDTLPDIKDAIQDQTQDITDIKDAIEDATQVPTDFEPQKHPLPRGVFPFCIPFDLHDIIVALDAAPVTPEVHIPFRIPTIIGMNFGLDYTFDLDLHDFDGLAQVLRTLEFIAFGVGLLFVTGKVIKW